MQRLDAFLFLFYFIVLFWTALALATVYRLNEIHMHTYTHNTMWSTHARTHTTTQCESTASAAS